MAPASAAEDPAASLHGVQGGRCSGIAQRLRLCLAERENFGLHLNLESPDTVSLPKILGTPFDEETQHLYEANEYGADFYPGAESRFEVDESEDDTSDLTALIDAVDAGGAGAPPSSPAAFFDLDEMTRQ